MFDERRPSDGQIPPEEESQDSRPSETPKAPHVSSIRHILSPYLQRADEIYDPSHPDHSLMAESVSEGDEILTYYDANQIDRAEITKLIGLGLTVLKKQAHQAEEEAAEARKRAEEAEKLAKSNETTGLPNHIALKERLNQIAEGEDYINRSISVLYLDVEGLGHVNDTISHQAGDFLLRSVARTIARTIRSDDELYHSTEDEETGKQPDELETGGRLYHKHGDEMQILLEDVEPQAAKSVAERVVGALKAEVLPAMQAQGYLVGRTESISCGVGIALKSPGELKDPEQLLHEGDIGMKTAKTTRQDNKRRNLEAGHSLPTSGIIVVNDGTLADPGYVKDKSLQF